MQSELVADMVGDYLFGDEKFVKSLAQNKNLFRRIYDEIKYLLKISGKGTKQEKEFARLKRAFEKALSESKNVNKNTAFSLSDSDNKMLENLDNFDTLGYNEIKLEKGELLRLQSAVMTNKSKQRNQASTISLSNGYTYTYILDSDGIVHPYSKKEIDNNGIGESYGNADATQSSAIVEELGNRQRNNNKRSGTSRNGRNSGGSDRFHNSSLQAEGRSNRGRSSQNDYNSHGRKKGINYRFDEDGHGTVTYSDGTTDKFSLGDSQNVESDDALAYNVRGDDIAYDGDDLAPLREDLNTDGVKYSLSKNARSEVELALNDKNYSDYVKLTDNTPSILLSQKGVRNLPMLMKPSHIRENIYTEEEAKAKGLRVDERINYHGLGKELFLDVISELDNVTEAYRGTKNADNPQRREKYFLLISKLTDSEGNVINIPVYINEKGTYHRVIIDTNKVSTVFGKENIRDYINRELRKGNIVRIKNRSNHSSDSTTPIVAQYDMDASDNSIAPFSKNVKENEKFSLSENIGNVKQKQFENDDLAPIREDLNTDDVKYSLTKAQLEEEQQRLLDEQRLLDMQFESGDISDSEYIERIQEMSDEYDRLVFYENLDFLEYWCYNVIYNSEVKYETTNLLGYTR